jgi:hypothetical protein
MPRNDIVDNESSKAKSNIVINTISKHANHLALVLETYNDLSLLTWGKLGKDL